MDAESMVTGMLRLQLVASATILVVLLLRPLALRWFGASIAYWLWLVVPLAALAVLLPARELVVVLPAPVGIPILQEQVGPALVAGVAEQIASAPPVAKPGVPYDRFRSGLLIALWLLGTSMFLIRSIISTRRLASSPSLGPALVGVLRPRLVLPRDFEARFNAEEQALILAHEEMHRVSRHTLVNALVEVARCASWFNPLMHWAAMRFRADQELACDTAVIAAHPEARHAYAEALLKAQVASVHLPMGCVWTSATAGRLAERIARLSEQLPGPRRRFAGAATIVGMGIAAGCAAWAQQPAQITTVQQSRPVSVAAVPTDIPVREAREVVRVAASQAPNVSRSPAVPVPVSIPTAQAAQAPEDTSTTAVEWKSVGDLAVYVAHEKFRIFSEACSHLVPESQTDNESVMARLTARTKAVGDSILASNGFSGLKTQVPTGVFIAAVRRDFENVRLQHELNVTPQGCRGALDNFRAMDDSRIALGVTSLLREFQSFGTLVGVGAAAVATLEGPDKNVAVEVYTAYVDHEVIKELFASAIPNADSSVPTVGSVVRSRAALEQLRAAHQARRAEIMSVSSLVMVSRTQGYAEVGVESWPSPGGTLESKPRQGVLRVTVTPTVAPDQSILLTLDIKTTIKGAGVTVADGNTVPSIDTSQMGTQVSLPPGDVVLLSNGLRRSSGSNGPALNQGLVILLTATTLSREPASAR